MYSPLVNPAPHAQGKADESGWPRWAAIQCRSAYLGLGPKENIRNSKSFWKLVWVVNRALPDLRSIWYRDIKRCKEAWSQLAAIWTSRAADTPDTIALRSDSQTWSFRLASRLLWWIRLCHRCFVTCVWSENDAAKIHCQIYRSKGMASARTSWTPGYLVRTNRSRWPIHYFQHSDLHIHWESLWCVCWLRSFHVRSSMPQLSPLSGNVEPCAPACDGPRF